MTTPSRRERAIMCLHMLSEPAASLALEAYMAAGRVELQRSRMLFDAALQSHRASLHSGSLTPFLYGECARDTIESASFWSSPTKYSFHI